MANYYALVPAAGTGSRMESRIPKQYLPIFDKPLIHHALSALCDYPPIERVFVVLAPDDHYWAHVDSPYVPSRLEPLFCGGETRAESVLNGLRAIHDRIGPDDWIMVHDAARPCIGKGHLDLLLAGIGDDEVGGLLAIPVADTLKRADRTHRVIGTEARRNLWQAQTPQMFRFRLLLQALEQEETAAFTDESQALERLGYQPKLVASDNRNIKVTYPQDLLVAKMILTTELEMEE
ncbi:MAG TPA: 2-C-methyl-D-erythritol 4-phosphate cytidylyltransferase [Betaproteobacteria bacterium]|nr:2-C-methyl-D-erythritol 4-phosphate cytidylyltransferase [Betaproteobacteria bacterium]